MLAVGLGFGAGHWHLVSMPVTFALIFPLVLLAAFAGTLSANLGLMLVSGYAIGDLFFAGPPAAWAARYPWPLDHFFHLTIPQLVSYLLFFMLAALPILNTRIMLGDLVRRGKFKRPEALPAKAFMVLSVLLLAAIHGAFVYTWTFTAPMIFRLSWVWAGQGASPFNITYFQNITVPWLPAAAVIAFLLRCWLEYQVGSNEASASSLVSVLAANQRVDAKPPADRPRMPETLLAALAVTLLSSGFFWSIPAGVVFLLVVTALFYLRAFVLPKRPAWQAWAQKAAALPIVIRAVGAIAASYFVTRLMLSINLSRFRQYGFIFKNFSASINDKGPADFWVELMCIALGLAITLALLPDGSLRPHTQDAPLRQASPPRPAYGLPMMMFIGSINFCLDPFCCFGASDFLVSLAIAALIALILGVLLALLLPFAPWLAPTVLYFGAGATGLSTLETIWGKNPFTGKDFDVEDYKRAVQTQFITLALLPFGSLFSRYSTQLAEALMLKISPPSLPPFPLKTVSMGQFYVTEHLPDNKIWPFGSQVDYLSEGERLAYKLEFRNGKIYSANGALFDTRGPNGTAIFVMDGDGNVYASTDFEISKFHHSSFLAGGDVASAGHMTVHDGQLQLITNQSGHYKPSSTLNEQVIKVLNHYGISTKGKVNNVR
jgi:hypothetical protein